MGPTSKYDIEKIRKQMSKKLSGSSQDPYEFRPKKAKENEEIKYRFYVLPGVMKGDKVNGGLASRDMELFFVQHGNHWYNKRPNACPRLYNGEDCELCTAGFDALHDIPKGEKQQRTAIAKQFLSSAVYCVNIYFPDMDPNPEELRGKVMFYNAQKQVFDMWNAAIQRNDGGSPIDPEAYGVFYDPYAAFLFQLVAKPFGDYNDYKSSKFIAQIGKHPIAMLDDKSPDEKTIERILNLRHDLYSKIDVPDHDKIHQLYRAIVHGVDEITPQTPEGMEARRADQTQRKVMPKVPDDDEVVLPTTKKSPGTQSGTPAVATQVVLNDEVPVTARNVKAEDTKKVAKAPPKPAVPDDDDEDIKSILAGLDHGDVDD